MPAEVPFYHVVVMRSSA